MDSRMSDEHPRIRREKKTIEAMLHIYCNKHHHGRGELCQECNGLLNYAKMRLDKCPFQENKTTCGNCLIHCYQPQMRAKVKAVRLGREIAFQSLKEKKDLREISPPVFH